MLADIAPNLHTFFAPQMQQLNLHEMPVHFGSYSEGSGSWGQGWLWVASIGSDCLISVHDLYVAESFDLFEYPSDFTCLAAASQAVASAAAQCCPSLPQNAPLAHENIMAFQQAGGEFGYALQAGEHYRSSSLTLTPHFFERLARQFPDEFNGLDEVLATASFNALPQELAGTLANLDPRRANLPGAQLYFTSKVMEALAITMGNTKSRSLTREKDERNENAKIVRETKLLIDEHLSEPLTLQSIADSIYVSRTHLCTSFKEETGTSVGEYLREARLRRARELLATTGLPISAVSKAVGYARQSSFAEAFKEDAGITPSEWRRASRSHASSR